MRARTALSTRAIAHHRQFQRADNSVAERRPAAVPGHPPDGGIVDTATAVAQGQTLFQGVTEPSVDRAAVHAAGPAVAME